MDNASAFLGTWDQYMVVGSVVCFVAGVLIFLFHEFKLFQIKDLKEKYDHVNQYEIKRFWYSVIAFIGAATFYANTLASSKITTDGMRWFYVRLFITISFAVIAYIISFSLVRIYYPRQLERRLLKLRNTPRMSPEGNPMRKMTGSEEDHHLESLESKDEIHAVDYDIWIDDKTGHKMIEKYPVYEHAEECSECGYYTMKLNSEEIEQAPTANEGGILLNHYKCTYCGHREQREIIVAKLSANAV